MKPKRQEDSSCVFAYRFCRGTCHRRDTDAKMLYRVQTGAFSKKANADAFAAKLKAAGYDAFITTNSGSAVKSEPVKKTAAEIAKEIFCGTCSDSRWSTWGNGATRTSRLKQAGYDPAEVQAEVNKLF